jgi:hypothetical protein
VDSPTDKQENIDPLSFLDKLEKFVRGRVRLMKKKCGLRKDRAEEFVEAEFLRGEEEEKENGDMGKENCDLNKGDLWESRKEGSSTNGKERTERGNVRMLSAQSAVKQKKENK